MLRFLSPRALSVAGPSMAVVALLSACNKTDAPAAPSATATPSLAAAASETPAAAARPASGASGPGNAPVTVTTVRAQKRDLPVQLLANGAVSPLSSVDVRAQVTSVVTRVHIKEGQFVKTGEPLFTLDSRTDEANVARARAQMAKDEVALADAQRQLARSRELLAQNFVSQTAVDTAQTLVDSQAAVVAADKAAVEAARVTLSFSRIVAPSGGRIGAVNVFPGSSVQANNTVLVTITQLNPVAVAFALPQRHLSDVLAALQGGGAPVEATLPEAKGRLKGRLQFVDNAVDAASGTVKVKAVFDNRDNQLWPGAFVDVAMTVRTLTDAVVVPQAAIIQSARGPIVYAVEDGKAALRPIQIVQAQGEDAAVNGVKPGDRIVLDGRQNLRPGVAVVERAREAGARPGAGGASGAGRARGEAAGPGGAGASAGASGAGLGAAPKDRSMQP